MLLEAAMSELCEDAAHGGLLQPPHTDHVQSRNSDQKPAEPKEGGQVHIFNVSQNNMQHPSYEENPSDCNTGDGHNPSLPAEVSAPLQDDDHRKLSLPEKPRVNVGCSVTNPFDYRNNADDNMANHGAISLLQEDNEFVNRVLNREPSNLGESSRFGGYRSTAAVAAVGVPFHWEAQPGKSKNPKSIREEEVELPPLSLPPIRGISSTSAHIPAYMSPSSSAAPSPRSLKGKMKSLIINHVKKPSMDHFTSMLETQKSPSKKSPHRSKRERKTSSLSGSEYGSMQSGSVSPSPYIYSAPFKSGHNMQKNEESYGPRSSLNSSSDPCSSPYYFSPLSNTSSRMSQGIMSPCASVTQSSSGSISSNCHSHHAVHHAGSHTSSRDSDSSISSINSVPGNVASSSGPAMLANCLLTITSMSDNQLAHEESENGNKNGSNSLSFVSPEMESIDEGLLAGTDYMDSMPETTMEDFINRGGPSMHRSLSTSRVTFADDFYRKPSPKSQFYSAQLNNLAQPKSNHSSLKQEDTHYTAKLDVLFPLKRPNGMEFTSSQAEESPDDKQAYVDALDSSLDCSVMTDNEELNSMVQSIMNDSIRKERPAQEVVMEANDENGFAYTPVASAFVFSPKKGASQNASPAAMHYFKPSTRANISNNAAFAGNCDGVNTLGQPKSILKKTYLQELNRHASFNVKTAAYDDMVGSAMQAHQKRSSHSGPLKSNPTSSSWRLAYAAEPKTLSTSSSQKISSVLLRFAEAEEKLYNSSKRHHGGIRSPAACMQPMCSFLGRALLCRSKLTSHAGPLQT